MLDARWKGYDHTELYVLQKKNNNAMGDEYCSINKKTQNYVQEFFILYPVTKRCMVRHLAQLAPN
jgi:hypothetical protein